jgi:hypothetical protein
MTTLETELKGLKLASLNGDAAMSAIGGQRKTSARDEYFAF